MENSGVARLGSRFLAIPMVVALTLMLGLSAPASAAVETEGPPGVEATGDGIVAMVNSGELTVDAPVTALNAPDATVQTLEVEEGVYTTVTVPIAGSYSVLSNLTVVFDAAGNVAQYSETLYSENQAGNFQITQNTDGELVKDEDLGVAYMTDAALIEDMKNSAPAEGADPGMSTMGVGAVAACLSGGLGIGGVGAYLLAGACGGSCVGGVVPICAACIGGYAAITAGGMGVVVGCFQLL